MNKMKKLINEINKHNYLYYTLGKPIIPDHEYDKLYDELVRLEEETDIIYSNSPTQKVGYELKKELEKNTLRYPLKSLDKTKDIESLKEFMGNRECVVMIKCDGLTNELNYIDNKLITATTRGNGEVGELITNNAKNYQNIPLQLCCDDVIVVGEAVIMKKDFLNLNSKLKEEDKFANPRNLVSGSVRQLNPNITRERMVSFIGFGINGKDSRYKTKERELGVLKGLGFDVTPFIKCTRENIGESIDKLKVKAESLGIPYDGMVIQYNDLSLKESLGSTSKFPRWAKAFKFEDEEAETTLRAIEYNASRNGVLTPVAVFDSVELEGTEVERASLHNINLMSEFKLGIGDEIVVFKANQIIPQVARNNTKSGNLRVIGECPYCKAKTQVRSGFLYCTNENCECRVTNRIAHFVSRNAMNIAGLSEKTIEKLLNGKFLTTIESLYSLKNHKEKLYCLEGMGKKSIDKLLQGIEDSKKVKDYNFLYALGIPQVGLSTAKVVCKSMNIKDILSMKLNDFREIDALGDVASSKLYDFISEHRELVSELLNIMEFEEVKKDKAESSIRLVDKVFVITGSVNIFKNRNEIKDRIEAEGGKVAGSVSAKTSYLINNDKESSTGKNKKAKDLGITIISEEEFMTMLQK